MKKLFPDTFTVSILAIVALAVLVPCRGAAGRWVDATSQMAIAVLFFLQGVRLSSSAVIAGILHWRVHLIIFAATFLVFPLIGMGLRPLSGTALPPPLYAGLLFLCCLPSAVQASVIFTSVAGGNVAAALCSASLSSIVGIVLTPLLVGALLSAHGDVPMNGIGPLLLHLLLPFVVGQMLQTVIGPWVQRHSRMTQSVDRASVLLMVYAVISAATLSGAWSGVSRTDFIVLAAIEAALLATMLGLTAFAARCCGLSRADRIAVMFCGSKKSLVSGIPMANALFADVSVGLLVLPLMIFHQLQLMTCAVLAQRYGARMTGVETEAPGALHGEQFAER